MTTLREAAQQALEGLEKWQWDKDPGGADDYINALRAALAEPVQRKPLTDDEVEHLLSTHERNYDMVNFARSIEKAHGIGGSE